MIESYSLLKNLSVHFIKLLRGQSNLKSKDTIRGWERGLFVSFQNSEFLVYTYTHAYVLFVCLCIDSFRRVILDKWMLTSKLGLYIQAGLGLSTCHFSLFIFFLSYFLPRPHLKYNSVIYFFKKMKKVCDTVQYSVLYKNLKICVNSERKQPREYLWIEIYTIYILPFCHLHNCKEKFI